MEDIFSDYTVPENGLKLTIADNEFQLRHQLLKSHPESKALLYSTTAKPADVDNWLPPSMRAGKPIDLKHLKKRLKAA